MIKGAIFTIGILAAAGGFGLSFASREILPTQIYAAVGVVGLVIIACAAII